MRAIISLSVVILLLLAGLVTRMPGSAAPCPQHDHSRSAAVALDQVARDLSGPETPSPSCRYQVADGCCHLFLPFDVTSTTTSDVLLPRSIARRIALGHGPETEPTFGIFRPPLST